MKRTPLKRKAPLRSKAAKPRRRRRLVAIVGKTKRDAEFSRMVRERAGWKCERCGQYFGPKAGARLHAAHIFSKGGFPHLRYDPDNAVSLCSRHHRFWAHIDAADFIQWVRGYIGEAKYEALTARAYSSPHGLEKYGVDTPPPAVVASGHSGTQEDTSRG